MNKGRQICCWHARLIRLQRGDARAESGNTSPHGVPFPRRCGTSAAYAVGGGMPNSRVVRGSVHSAPLCSGEPMGQHLISAPSAQVSLFQQSARNDPSSLLCTIVLSGRLEHPRPQTDTVRSVHMIVIQLVPSLQQCSSTTAR